MLAFASAAYRKFPARLAAPTNRLMASVSQQLLEAPARPYIPPENIQSPKSLNVAVVGAPNSGKSTIVNALVKSKVAAVSPKYNTTRDRILGIYTSGNTQVVFTDTPGFVPSTGEGSGRYVASLVTAATESIPLSDIVLFVVDAARRWDSEQEDALANVAKLCKSSNAGLFLVANKIDLLRGENVSPQRVQALKTELLSLQKGEKKASKVLPVDVDWENLPPAAAPLDTEAAAHLQVVDAAGNVHGGKPARQKALTALQMKLELLLDAFEQKCYDAQIIGPSGFDSAPAEDNSAVAASIYRFLKPMYPVCALRGEGISELRDSLMKLAVPRDWEFSKRMTTDRTELERAVEIIREKIFLNLHREVPYSVRQLNRSLKRNESGDLIIEQDLLVPKKSVASMLLGRGRAPLKAISLAAIKDMEEAFGCKVHLFLHVSVKPAIGKGNTGEAGGLKE